MEHPGQGFLRTPGGTPTRGACTHAWTPQCMHAPGTECMHAQVVEPVGSIDALEHGWMHLVAERAAGNRMRGWMHDGIAFVARHPRRMR